MARFDADTGVAYRLDAAEIEFGDLSAVKERGRLRIAVLRGSARDRTLVHSVERQRALAAQAAEAIGVVPVWTVVDDLEAMQRVVREGRADVGVPGTPVRIERPSRLLPTTAIAELRYVVVTEQKKAREASRLGLAGMRVAVTSAAPGWLLRRIEGAARSAARVVSYADSTSAESLLSDVAAGRIDAVVLPSDGFDPRCGTCAHLAAAFELGPSQPVSFWVRADAPALRQALNAALEAAAPALRAQPLYLDDLDGLRRRGVLRVITAVEPDGFSVVNGEPTGLSVELVRRFAKSEGLRIEYLVGDTPEQLVRWLKSGAGDIVTARIPVATASSGGGVARSRAFAYDTPVILSTEHAAPLRIEELAGRRIAARRDSPHWDTLQSLRSSGLDVALVEAPRAASDLELAAGVAQGRYDLAVISGDSVPAALEQFADVRAALSLYDDQRFRWLVRGDAQQLRSAIDTFFAAEYKGAFLNELKSRYVLNDALATREARVAASALSPFDALARRYAQQYGFDWRLVVAVMYEESQFNPSVRSASGAGGLMQVMPGTARELGIEAIERPADGIQAGVAYLDALRARFERALPVAERTWFALAAYHLGYGRVERARQRAVRMGLDPNRWADNVERAMLAMTPAGTSRCPYRSTVRYVRDVRSRFSTYVQFTDVAFAASPTLAEPHRG